MVLRIKWCANNERMMLVEVQARIGRCVLTSLFQMLLLLLQAPRPSTVSFAKPPTRPGGKTNKTKRETTKKKKGR